MGEPRWPVFLLDGGDVKVVTGPMLSRSMLERFVADRSVEFYDALGRIVRVVVDVSQRSRRLLRFRNRQDLRLEVISEEQHEDRLRLALTNYLQANGRVVPDQVDLLIFASVFGLFWIGATVLGGGKERKRMRERIERIKQRKVAIPKTLQDMSLRRKTNEPKGLIYWLIKPLPDFDEYVLGKVGATLAR